MDLYSRINTYSFLEVFAGAGLIMMAYKRIHGLLAELLGIPISINSKKLIFNNCLLSVYITYWHFFNKIS